MSAKVRLHTSCSVRVRGRPGRFASCASGRRHRTPGPSLDPTCRKRNHRPARRRGLRKGVAERRPKQVRRFYLGHPGMQLRGSAFEGVAGNPAGLPNSLKFIWRLAFSEALQHGLRRDLRAFGEQFFGEPLHIFAAYEAGALVSWNSNAMQPTGLVGFWGFSLSLREHWWAL